MMNIETGVSTADNINNSMYHVFYNTKTLMSIVLINISKAP